MKKPHPESCWFCRHRWYNEETIGEVVSMGRPGYVCDGHHKIAGIANLKSFPFRTKQSCFGPKIKDGE